MASVLITDEKDFPVSILTEEHLSSKNVSVVKLVARIQDDVIEVYGDSRRAPGDKPDIETGYLLAVGRAYESLARKVKRRANGLVNRNDNVREIRPVQRERSRQWHERRALIVPPMGTNERENITILRAIREQEGSAEKIIRPTRAYKSKKSQKSTKSKAKAKGKGKIERSISTSSSGDCV